MTPTLTNPLNGAITNAIPYETGATAYWRVIVRGCWSVTAVPRRRCPRAQYRQRPFQTRDRKKNVPEYTAAAIQPSESWMWAATSEVLKVVRTTNIRSTPLRSMSRRSTRRMKLNMLGWSIHMIRTVTKLVTKGKTAGHSLMRPADNETP